VGKAHWRGELLDGAALAARQLERPDLPRRLEAAWRSAATLPRLLRWIASDGHTVATIRAKAKKALNGCPKNDGRQLGLIRVLAGDMHAAVDLLAKAPGLGWSSPEHPGHTLFPLLAMLLPRGPQQQVVAAFAAEVEATGRDLLDSFADDVVENKPKLTTPSIVSLIQYVRPSMTLTEADHHVAIGVMKIAAERRVEGILGNSRRRHYSHAALLVVSCLALAPKGRTAELSKWFADLRQQYSRRSAFREELTRACESLGVSVSA